MTKAEQIQKLERQLRVQLEREAATVRGLWDEIYKERKATDVVCRQLQILATAEIDRSLEIGRA